MLYLMKFNIHLSYTYTCTYIYRTFLKEKKTYILTKPYKRTLYYTIT